LPRKFSPTVQNKVRQRAGYLCEYCHTDERWQLVQFTIDHIIPLSKGGTDEIDNLALACFHCNRQKSNNLSYKDVLIFNPRQSSWNEHFCWSKNGLRILAKTEIGEVTIELLRLNRERILQIRQDDILVNRHPPKDDSIENSE
jgi:HNH endonuclease